MAAIGAEIEEAKPSTAEAPALQALVSVLAELQRRGISFCYWKSSRRLPAVFAGDGDVDLLVARSDQHKTQAILLEMDFKLFPSVPSADHPAVLTYLGHDECSGQLIHLHLHFSLIVGERLLQNYRLPWSDALISSAVPHDKLPISLLDPASEALMLMVRASLEFSYFDPATLRGWRATMRKFELDRAGLVVRVDRGELHKRASELLNEDLAKLVVDSFFGSVPLDQASVCHPIKKHCARFRTYNTIEARLRSAWRALFWVAGAANKSFLRLPRPWNRRAPGGGRLIAIIGLDGSGKSTINAVIRTWLGSKVDLVPIYFGTGDGRPTLLLWPFKLLQPLAALLIREKPRVASHGKATGPAPGLLYSALLTVWALIVALDKQQKLTASRRGVNRGLVILTDRYPQNQLKRYNDGPLLNRLEGISEWLRRLEQGVYEGASQPPPDLVIKLTVTSATATKREPTMDLVVIEQRIKSLQELAFPGARVVSVDAEQSLPEVIRTVKREIWSLL